MKNLRTRDHRTVLFRELIHTDYDKLTSYLTNLSDESKRRFGPHPFTRSAVEEFHQSQKDVTGFVAIDQEQNVVAYALIARGVLDEDQPRFLGYGLLPDANSWCTFAPSVADQWQSCGLGSQMFECIAAYCSSKGYKNVMLWGGVQSTNTKAVNYYLKLGFVKLGEFEHNGPNDDMMLQLS